VGTDAVAEIAAAARTTRAALEVDIEPPTNLIDDSDRPPFPVVLYEVAGELWRMKRAYDRRHPPPA
jgi:hypothetical protein